MAGPRILPPVIGTEKLAIYKANGDKAVYDSLISEIESSGGRILVRQPYDTVIAVVIETAGGDIALKVAGAEESDDEELMINDPKGYLEAMGIDKQVMATLDLALAGDALTQPVPVGVSTTLPKNTLASSPIDSASWATSEYAAGSISIAVMLPESTGAGDPKTHSWSEASETKAINAVNFGMALMAIQSPDARLSYTVHVYRGRLDPRLRVDYEPINNVRRQGEMEACTKLYAPVMAALGYGEKDGADPCWYSREGGRWLWNVQKEQKRFINDMRAADGSDWGLIVYLLNGLNQETFIAFAYLGGPQLVLACDNLICNYGVLFLTMVHEVGHTFYALDEYLESGSACGETSGYLNVPNKNSTVNDGNCDTEQHACLMDSGTRFWSMLLSGGGLFDNLLYCNWSRGQLGWWDTNGNGIPDPLDTTPNVGISTPVRTASQDQTLHFTVTGQDVPLKNRNRIWWGPGNPPDISINAVEYATFSVKQNGYEGITEYCDKVSGSGLPKTRGSFECSTYLIDGYDAEISVEVENSAGNIGVLKYTEKAPKFIQAVTPLSAKVGDTVAFKVQAEGFGNPLFYSVTTSPSGSQFNTQTGEFSWKSTYAGTWIIDFKAHNGVLSDTMSVTVNVDGDDPGPCKGCSCTKLSTGVF